MPAPRTPGVGPWPGGTPGTPCPRACRSARSTRRNSRRTPGSAPGRPHARSPAPVSAGTGPEPRGGPLRSTWRRPTAGGRSDRLPREAVRTSASASWSMTRLRAIWWTQARKLPPRNPAGSGLPHLRPHVLIHVVEYGHIDPPAEEREQSLRVPVVEGAEGDFSEPSIVRRIVTAGTGDGQFFVRAFGRIRRHQLAPETRCGRWPRRE